MKRGLLSVYTASILILGVLTLGHSSVVYAVYDEEMLSAQRKVFLDAKKAVRHGQIRTYRRLSKKLVDYPLYGYLEYEYLRKRIHRVSSDTIKEFLEKYDDSPISNRLRRAWLRHLYGQRRYNTFLEEFKPTGSTRMRCLKANALFKVGRIEEAMEETDHLWMVGESRPKTCNSVFKTWKSHGGQSREMVWGRIELAMKRGRTRLAKFLANGLTKQDQIWVDRWINMHRKPARNLHRKVYRVDSPEARKIFRHGVKRLARRDAGAAADVWDGLRDQHLDAEPDETHTVDQYVAMRAAAQKHPRALELLGKLEKPNEKALDWRVRAALAQQDWWSALTWIESLPQEQRETDQWRYWRARILEMQSRDLPVLRTAAERIFGTLAEERSYHGFLSADRIGVEYDFDSRPLIFSEEELSEVAQIPAVKRAYELFRLGLKTDARREWNGLTHNMEQKKLRMVSVLASRWEWHDRAILTIAKSDHYDDLDLRFPMAYKDLVMKNADTRNIDPAWIYGVLRQESVFMEDAKSRVGALGLMQLMPKTGRITAKQLNSRIRSNREILDVRKNIRLGSAYLKRMLERNNGHSALATAAYNAGPHRVRKWMPSEPLSADLWVETIPFTETRNYVQRVMAYTVIYDYRLDGEIKKMRGRMPVVNPNSPS